MYSYKEPRFVWYVSFPSPLLPLASEQGDRVFRASNFYVAVVPVDTAPPASMSNMKVVFCTLLTLQRFEYYCIENVSAFDQSLHARPEKGNMRQKISSAQIGAANIVHIEVNTIEYRIRPQFRERIFRCFRWHGGRWRTIGARADFVYRGSSIAVNCVPREVADVLAINRFPHDQVGFHLENME